MTGLRQIESGQIRVCGQAITGADPRHARRAGVGHIAEDRHRRGLVLDFDLTENLALRDYRTGSRWGLLSLRRMLESAKRLIGEFDVRGGTPSTLARSLSGGNQQKVVIAREISGNPEALVAAQPTRGLDVGAIEFVHRRLLAERDAGKAILLVSLELEEVRNLADRILVDLRRQDRRGAAAERIGRGARAAHDGRHRPPRPGRCRPSPHRRPSRAEPPPAPAAWLRDSATTCAPAVGSPRSSRRSSRSSSAASSCS